MKNIFNNKPSKIEANIIGWFSACRILKLKNEAHNVAINAPTIEK